MVYTYFTTMKNSRGLLVVYGILNTPVTSDTFIDREQALMQNASLQGNMFYRETKKFLAILKELTVDTDSETWMKAKRCGR